MSRLLDEIRRSNKTAADVLEKADLRTDADIQSLTREELHELFPENKNFKLRRTIFDIIHKQKPIDVILRELKEFIPHESFRTALTNNGVLVDYLHIMKDIKTQINNVQNVLDAHIAILEEFSKNPPDQEPVSCNPVKLPNGQPDGRSQGARDTLEYKVIVGGKTFGAHRQLMEKVRDQVQDQVQLIESSQDYKLTFVFCPICSRVASDIEAAMTYVTDDKPVILVLMHHAREVRYTTSMRTWSDHANVVLHVNVFYHETVHGLLKDQQNDAAVTQIQNKLLECFVPKSEYSSGNAQGGYAASGLTCSTSVRGGGNNRASETDGYSGVSTQKGGKSRWWQLS
ncbi:uncharacterized protein LOC114573323 isoform X4 [Perca flavescens]|uniref:uncharacterized protein LOC114573323 isoform X4 n=1 Tax=Perca flavescens TaxID=8167 RepID=UPI00106E7E8B|nr:uncharacterized protein LOC114573323 isoform X4 [Perca flavescens]